MLSCSSWSFIDETVYYTEIEEVLRIGLGRLMARKVIIVLHVNQATARVGRMRVALSAECNHSKTPTADNAALVRPTKP